MSKGSKTSNNEMTVTKPSKKTQTAGDKIDDASITGPGQDDAALSSLDQCPQYLGHNEEWCGHINRQGQKRSGKGPGHQIVNDVNGVKSVKNQMTIE